MIEQKTIDSIIKLDKRVKSATSQIHNSAVVCTVYDPALGAVFGELELTVPDLLLIAAITEVHMLLTGPTGCAKTDIAELVCGGLFGNEGFKTLRLNTGLSEDTISDTDTRKLFKGECTVNESIRPEDYLTLPGIVLDEVNRAPSVLANLLLGLNEKKIHIKCGIKNAEVGYKFRSPDGQECRYHFVIATMNEGKEYSGIFPMDPAFRRRFPIEIPLGDLRPTPHDDLRIDEQRNGAVEPINYDSLIEDITRLTSNITELPLDHFAKIYLLYLKNVGRCPNSPSGFHPEDNSHQLCIRSECRAQKVDNSFCSSVGGLSKAGSISLKRVSCGMALLRIARTVEAIEQACREGDADTIEKLRHFADSSASGNKLRRAVLKKYLTISTVQVGDIKAMFPFIALGGKVWMSPEYVAKNFLGFRFSAMQNYAQLTYSKLKSFFAQNRALFEQLPSGNGTVEKLKKRLEHAERTSDPFIRPTIEAYLDKYHSKPRNGDQIAEEITAIVPVRDSARELLCGKLGMIL